MFFSHGLSILRKHCSLIAPGLVRSILCLLFPAAGLGWLLRQYCARGWNHRERWTSVWIGTFVSLSLSGLLVWRLHPFPTLLLRIWQSIRMHRFDLAGHDVLLLWLSNGLLLACPAALIYEALMPRIARSATLIPRRKLPSLRQLRRQAPLSQCGGSPTPGQPALVPDQIGDAGVVGQALGGDLSQWVRNGWFTVPLVAFTTHAVAVGKSRTGKSEMLRRMAYIAARVYGMKVMWIDGKGDWRDAARFQLTMQAAGCHEVGIFPLDAHSGWRGSRQDILNRLMSCQVFTQEYYRDVTYNLLKLAIYLPGLAAPTSGKEFLHRLYPPHLKASYKDTEHYQYLQSLKVDALWGPHGRYTALYNGVQDRLDGTKGFGDWDAAYYLLDKKRLQDQIAAFGRFLLDDFALYLALRRFANKSQRVLLILDDYSAYSRLVSIVDLFERISAYGGCVIASAQGYEGLGPEAKRIIETAATSIVHQCVLPRQLIEAAGTLQVPELAVSLNENEDRDEEMPTERTTLRMKEEPRVLPNDVQQLAVGEDFFICNGVAQKVLVARVPLEEQQVAQLETGLYRAYEQAQQVYEEGQIAQAGGKQAKQSKAKAKPSDSPLTAPILGNNTPAVPHPSTASPPPIQVQSIDDIQ